MDLSDTMPEVYLRAQQLDFVERHHTDSSLQYDLAIRPAEVQKRATQEKGEANMNDVSQTAAQTDSAVEGTDQTSSRIKMSISDDESDDGSDEDSEDDSDDDSDEEDAVAFKEITITHSDLKTAEDIWHAYDYDTHELDLTNEAICQGLRRAYERDRVRYSGRRGPPDEILRDALKELREKNEESRCSDTYVFELWNAKELYPGGRVQAITIRKPEERAQALGAVGASPPLLDTLRMSDEEFRRMLDGLRK